MSFRNILSTLLFTTLATTTPVLQSRASKQVAFFLAGDSTTATQSSSGGGWGDGFRATLISPASGTNKGHNGATTVSFVSGGDWDKVLELVKNHTNEYDVYVTIQFGHNDQKAEKGISMSEFKINLKNLAANVTDLGATPLIFTSLTRRNFDGNDLIDDLSDVVPAAREAADEADVKLIDLNAASRKYVQAIGSKDADKYNLRSDDRTHLNKHGSEIFGRMVADLLLDGVSGLNSWITKNETLSRLIADGVYA